MKRPGKADTEVRVGARQYEKTQMSKAEYSVVAQSVAGRPRSMLAQDSAISGSRPAIVESMQSEKRPGTQVGMYRGLKRSSIGGESMTSSMLQPPIIKSTLSSIMLRRNARKSRDRIILSHAANLSELSEIDVPPQAIPQRLKPSLVSLDHESSRPRIGGFRHSIDAIKPRNIKSSMAATRYTKSRGMLTRKRASIRHSMNFSTVQQSSSYGLDGISGGKM